MLGVNVMGVVHGLRHFVPRMLEAETRGVESHVVNTASIAGWLATPMLGVYNVSKHAVVALTETLFHDLRTAGSRHRRLAAQPGLRPHRHRPIGAEPPGRPRRRGAADPLPGPGPGGGGEGGRGGEDRGRRGRPDDLRGGPWRAASTSSPTRRSCRRCGRATRRPFPAVLPPTRTASVRKDDLTRRVTVAPIRLYPAHHAGNRRDPAQPEPAPGPAPALPPRPDPRPPGARRPGLRRAPAGGAVGPGPFGAGPRGRRERQLPEAALPGLSRGLPAARPPRRHARRRSSGNSTPAR